MLSLDTSLSVIPPMAGVRGVTVPFLMLRGNGVMEEIA